MDELESRLSSVLSDPEQMEKITRLAQSFMAGTGSGSAAPKAETDTMPDAELFKRLAQLISMGGGREKGEQAMLEAISPYLSEKRRGKMEKALRIAKLVRIARLAMEEQNHA